MEVKGRIRRCRHVLVGVVASAGCDIFEKTTRSIEVPIQQ
jgi:hypothetical protein